MATAETLLTLCLPDEAQRAALLAQTRENLTRWSPWLTPLATAPGFHPQTEALIAIQRFVDAAHVAQLLVFLCGEAGTDITGAVLPVEGGWLAS